MSKKFANKLVVITGGSEGIGLATARLFSEEGAHVYVTARRQAQLEVAVQKIGHGAVGVQGDVADPASLDRLYKRIREEHGRIDVLFANAGISESASLDDIDETHIDRIFNVNVKGTIFTVQKALALMSAGSTIILPGSIAGSKGIPSLSIYSATKAAIRSFRTHLDYRPQKPRYPCERCLSRYHSDARDACLLRDQYGRGGDAEKHESVWTGWTGG